MKKGSKVKSKASAFLHQKTNTIRFFKEKNKIPTHTNLYPHAYE